MQRHTTTKITADSIQMDGNALAKLVDAFMEKAESFYRGQGAIEIPNELRESPLGLAAVRLVKMLIKDAHRKMDEHIAAAENPHLKVSEKAHGADLHDRKTGSKTEHKSVTSKGTNSSANVNWPIGKPGGASRRRREKVLESIKDKTDAGGAIISIKDGFGREFKEYRLSHEFLMGYFARVPLGSCGNHNMGCKRCPDCGEFHRLAKFEHYSNLERELDEKDWREVFAQTAFRCRRAML